MCLCFLFRVGRAWRELEAQRKAAASREDIFFKAFVRTGALVTANGDDAKIQLEAFPPNFYSSLVTAEAAAREVKQAAARPDSFLVNFDSDRDSDSEAAVDEAVVDEAIADTNEVDSGATESEEKEKGPGSPNETASDQDKTEHSDVDFTIDFVQTYEKLSHAAQLAQAPFAAVNKDRSLAARIATEFEALKNQWLQARPNRKTLPTRLYDEFDQQARATFAPPTRSSRSRGPSERCVSAFDSFVQI